MDELQIGAGTPELIGYDIYDSAEVKVKEIRFGPDEGIPLEKSYVGGKINYPLVVGNVQFNSAPGVAQNVKDMCQSFYRPSQPVRVARGTLLIGICGNARAGKNTVAEHIVEKYEFKDVRSGALGFDIRSYAFADALKVEVYDWLSVFGCYCVHTDMFNTIDPYTVPVPSRAAVSDSDKIAWIELNKDLLRDMLQKHGTELRRQQDETYWISRLLAQVANDRPAVALISDVRFRNEVDVCHVTVKVERNGYVEPDKSVGQHVSETELSDVKCDYVISVPDGRLELLKLEAEGVFEEILEKFRVQ